ncbi:ABC transporter ATP-binding protein [Halobacteriales archaeon QS_4_62_28]|nr:MAG: ABC transporter ATP-binding protein [Halobacteriales archaeon QS_4_62_28]
MSDQDPILAVSDLRKSFGGIQAVDGATFDVATGTITGLIGPNGAGKTTTFNLVSGFLEPDGGEISFKGVDVQELMRPSGEENRIWTTAAGVTAGGIGVAGTASIGAGPPAMLAAGVIGASVGVGAYYGQERVKRATSHRATRPYQMARHGLSRTFQITRELQGMTVFENLLLAPQDQRGEQLLNAWFRRDTVAEDERRVRERAEEVLGLLELDHLRTERAGNLSGGQRKLLELGRVLMTDPDLVLLDEPVAGVNPALTRNLLDRIEQLRDEGYTFLIVEHDMEVIMELSDTIIVMDQGQKLTDGTPAEIQADERVVEAYLGG